MKYIVLIILICLFLSSCLDDGKSNPINEKTSTSIVKNQSDIPENQDLGQVEEQGDNSKGEGGLIVEPVKQIETIVEPIIEVKETTKPTVKSIVEDEVVIEKELIIPKPVIIKPEIIPEPEPEKTITPVVSNVSEVVSHCKSLCGSDKDTYCTHKQEVIFGENQTTYGTCRSLSKYNRSFSKCESFCKSYGENKGSGSYCKFSDGSSDKNCNGKIK